MTIGRPRIFSSHPAGVTAHIEPGAHLELLELAKKRGVTMAALLREGIDLLLAKAKEAELVNAREPS